MAHITTFLQLWSSLNLKISYLEIEIRQFRRLKRRNLQYHCHWRWTTVTALNVNDNGTINFVVHDCRILFRISSGNIRRRIVIWISNIRHTSPDVVKNVTSFVTFKTSCMWKWSRLQYVLRKMEPLPWNTRQQSFNVFDMRTSDLLVY